MAIEENRITTLNDYMDKLALSKDRGNRNTVKVARIHAGIEVKYAVGTAREQLLIADPRPGGGVQYLFNQFDTDWITEIRSFSNLRRLLLWIKEQELLKKLHLLVQEIDKAKEMVDEEKSQYLNNYENRIEAVIKKLQDGTLPASKGGLIGTMRGISEYDSLASIKALYDAASDVDLFYSKECQKW